MPFVKQEKNYQLISHWQAYCLSTHLHSASFLLLLSFPSLCQKPGPLLVPLVAAFFGSGRQQVACDEKFSVEPNSGDREEGGGGYQGEE